MASQLEHRKKALARLEAEYPGVDSPFKQGLRAQIALDEKPRADNPMGTGRNLSTALSAGMRQDLPSSAPEKRRPMTQDELAEGYARMTVAQKAKLFDDLM
jgi:hypothetical protein